MISNIFYKRLYFVLKNFISLKNLSLFISSSTPTKSSNQTDDLSLPLLLPLKTDKFFNSFNQYYFHL